MSRSRQSRTSRQGRSPAKRPRRRVAGRAHVDFRCRQCAPTIVKPPRRGRTARGGRKASTHSGARRSAASRCRSASSARTTTLSAAPGPSITVTRTKPGPSGAKNSGAAAGLRRNRHAIDQHRERRDAAGDLERRRGSGLAVAPRQFEPGAVRREQDVQRWPARPRRAGRRAKALQRRRQFGGRAITSAPSGRAAAAAGGAADAGEGVEQDRRRRAAADEARHRRAVGPADPDADRVPAVEADRPGIAVAVAGAGLERDAAGGAVLRRRRAEQHVADVPGGDRLHQPARLRARSHRGAPSLDQRHRRAEPRNAGIEHHQIGEPDADAAKAHRETRRLALRAARARRRLASAARQAGWRRRGRARRPPAR